MQLLACALLQLSCSGTGALGEVVQALVAVQHHLSVCFGT